MPESFHTALGRRIRERREALGLTQRDLGKLLGGKKHNSICAVERGKHGVPLHTAMVLAKALHCTVSVLLGEVQPAAVTAGDRWEARALNAERKLEAVRVAMRASYVDRRKKGAERG